MELQFPMQSRRVLGSFGSSASAGRTVMAAPSFLGALVPRLRAQCWCLLQLGVVNRIGWLHQDCRFSEFKSLLYVESSLCQKLALRQSFLNLKAWHV